MLAPNRQGSGECEPELHSVHHLRRVPGPLALGRRRLQRPDDLPGTPTRHRRQHPELPTSRRLTRDRHGSTCPGPHREILTSTEAQVASPRGDDLTRVPLCLALTAEDRDAVAGSFTVDAVPAGSTLVHEGRAGYAFYVVAEGQVEVAKQGETVRRLGPGDFFGAIAIIGKGRRSATTATTPTATWTMFGTEFRVLQQDRPDVFDRTSAGDGASPRPGNPHAVGHPARRPEQLATPQSGA